MITPPGYYTIWDFLSHTIIIFRMTINVIVNVLQKCRVLCIMTLRVFITLHATSHN